MTPPITSHEDRLVNMPCLPWCRPKAVIGRQKPALSRTLDPLVWQIQASRQTVDPAKRDPLFLQQISVHR